MKRKTSKKKFAKKCKEIHRLIRDRRTQPLENIIKKLNQILVGYYHYYGITDNIQSLNNFRFRVIRSLFQWLNRRSQKKSYTWEDAFEEMPALLEKFINFRKIIKKRYYRVYCKQ
uniref:group II intron maturase-specific domain-containing protein n=1 Tax=Agathobacter sp. TaxID=2021311 RepID=UPI00405718C5